MIDLQKHKHTTMQSLTFSTARTGACLLIAGALAILSCDSAPAPADLILFNGNICTVDSLRPQATALAIRDGLLVAVGSDDEMQAYQGTGTERKDLRGNFVMPGFIEGHGHFSGMGYSLIDLNFLKAKNWDEIVAAVEAAARQAKPGEWIVGRGWHQEKWDRALERHVQGYPWHDHLSEVSPDNPVLLHHASGHALIANQAAMTAAGVSRETPDPHGGHIVRGPAGDPIGVFEERAMAAIAAAHQSYLESLQPAERLERWYRGIELAQAKCLANGITSFQDAGSSFEELDRYAALAEEGRLDIRLWAMARHPSDVLREQLSRYPRIDLGDRHFTCRAIKTELDGALGSYGAWLLESYADKPGFTGQNTTPLTEVEAIADLALSHGMQLCVHTIGDRANRELLDLMEKITAEKKGGGQPLRELRWRSEHAQHIDPADIPRFAELGVIASMQAIHCTSDAPFVEKRLGRARTETGAYPWQQLLQAGAVVTNGTDVPVEDISPLENFYASVTRKRHQEAYQGFALAPEQRMTREQAIYSYTMACAYSAFEDSWKGSLSPGKVADLVVLSHDLLTCPDEDILETKVLTTLVGGVVKAGSW